VDDNRLIVAGVATTERTPDRVEWELVVRETDADARAAFARCTMRLRALAAALSDAEITTGPVAVSPEYGERHTPTGRQQARASLTAVAPLANAGELAAAAIEGGADELRGPTLRTSGLDEALDALYAEAVHAARRRAERMAEAAGRTLGRVLSARDHIFDDEFGDRYGGAQLMSLTGGGGQDPPVVPKPVSLRVAIQVVFELSD